MLILRILGDYQTKLRYAHDQQLEKEAYEALQAKEPVDERIEKALNTLRKTWLEPVGVKERFQMQRLADELYRSCKSSSPLPASKASIWTGEPGWIR